MTLPFIRYRSTVYEQFVSKQLVELLPVKIELIKSEEDFRIINVVTNEGDVTNMSFSDL